MNKHIFLNILIALLFTTMFYTARAQSPAQPAPWDGTVANSIANEGGGNGISPERAIRIVSAAELAYIATQINSGDGRLRIGQDSFLPPAIGEGFRGAHFRLMQNIDLGGLPWTPIATGPATDIAPSFNGTFDGDGNRISNLSIPNSNGLAGLFGFIGREGIVQNLHITVCTLLNSPNSYIGGIAGWNDGTIRHCITSGTGSVNGGYAGGIAGMNTNCLSQCYSTLHIKGSNAGGIAGSNAADTLSFCFAIGTITAETEAGGIASYNGINGTIHHCLALNTSGITTTGGINPHTGRIVNDNDGDLTANFATPTIPGTWRRQGTASPDGIDLAPTSFRTAIGPFGGWSTAAWHFDPEAIRLPSLRTTTGNVINDQPVLIRTDYYN